MLFPNWEKFLWVLLSSVVVAVFLLGFYDPTLRPQVLDFAKVALGAILTAVTATVTAKSK
jgi:formate hydrogenlyase subunit 4